MNISLKMQKRGIITVPKKIRDVWNVREGDLLDLEVKNGKVILNPVIALDKEIINASKNALKELKLKKIAGPFSSMDDFEEFLKKK